jgi:hypothetical protein
MDADRPAKTEATGAINFGDKLIDGPALFSGDLAALPTSPARGGRWFWFFPCQ